MKAMIVNSYGEDAVFEATEVEKPEVTGRSCSRQDRGIKRQHR